MIRVDLVLRRRFVVTDSLIATRVQIRFNRASFSIYPTNILAFRLLCALRPRKAYSGLLSPRIVLPKARFNCRPAELAVHTGRVPVAAALHNE